MRVRSRSEQKAMFSRLSSYSDFNKRLNAEFVKGIPSSYESVFTDKTMELDTPWIGNLSPYKRDVFGLDLSDDAVSDKNCFSVTPEEFSKVINIEQGIRHYRVNEPYYLKYGISLDDFLTVEESKRRVGD